MGIVPGIQEKILKCEITLVADADHRGKSYFFREAPVHNGRNNRPALRDKRKRTGSGGDGVKGGIDALMGEHEPQTIGAHDADTILFCKLKNLEFKVSTCLS